MIHKKRKKKASFSFSGHIQGRFHPISAVSGLFRPYQLGSARIEANSTWIEPRRCESEKKKNADTNRCTGNRVRRRVSRRAASDAGVAPLVPHLCFLHYLCLKTPFPQNLFLFIMSFGQEFPARNTAAVAVHRTSIVFHSLKKLA